MLRKTFVIAITCVAVSALGQQPNGTCGINGIPLNTSLTNPFTLPPLSDFYYPHPLTMWGGHGLSTGTFVGIEGDTTGHGRYLEYSYAQDSYYIRSKSLTNWFTYNEEVRELLTNVKFECLGGSTSQYYLKIPFVDKTAPRFENGQFSFTILVDWDLSRPINDLAIITVCDNAFELGQEKTFLIDATPSSLVQVVATTPYGLVTYRGHEYCSDVNLYLRNPLQAGIEYTVSLAATDPHLNVGWSVIKIKVES